MITMEIGEGGDTLKSSQMSNMFDWGVVRRRGTDRGVLLEYPTTTGFQWGLLKNGPYTYIASGGNGRVF